MPSLNEATVVDPAGRGQELRRRPPNHRKRQRKATLLSGDEAGLVFVVLKFHGNSASSALLGWPFAMRSITAAI
jgi:hypothetical protein